MIDKVKTNSPPASGRNAAGVAVRPTTGPRPGGPQRRRRQQSRYGIQLEEKRNLKNIYGLREEQLRKYYREAFRSSSETGPALIGLLERRLDNAIYRAGFAPTRAAARQMASHAQLTVNGRVTNIPSIRLGVNDVIAIKEGKRGKVFYENFEKRLQNVALPSWLALKPAEFSFSLTALPAASEANIGVDMRAIIELYSR